jgi:IS1 family transposase
MNKLSTGKRAAVVAALVEGSSVRATCRITDTSKVTVLRLLADLGTACAEYQDEVLRNLPCKRVQCDEIWSFVAMKEKNIPAERRRAPGIGSIWTWTAICADTKLVPAWHVGTRDAGCAYEFITDLPPRLRSRVQLTTDGHKAYLEAVDYAFGGAIDYAMLIKLYGAEPAGEARYSPAKCIGTRREVISGDPDPEHVSTSYVELQNLSMRMGIRRFTRLTNAFSKKVENHVHALSIYFMHYNFVRIHQTLRCTPAMEAKVTDRLWSLDDVAALVEAREESAAVITRKGWAKRKAGSQ